MVVLLVTWATQSPVLLREKPSAHVIQVVESEQASQLAGQVIAQVVPLKV
jgi:hypothetical protein